MISNHLKSRHVWKCQNMFTWTSHCHVMTSQSLAKDVCKEQMPRGAARCRVASFSLRRLRLSKRLSEKQHIFTEQMHPEFGVYVQMEDWNEDGTHPNDVEMSPHRTLSVLFFKLWIMCAFTWYKIVLDIFFISPKESKLKAVAHLSSLSSLHGAIPRRPRRRRPSTAELLEGSTTPNHPETLQSMNSLATLL